MRLVFDSRRAAIRLAKRLRYEKSHLSFDAIAAVLNQRGHRNTIGKPFNADSVERLLGEKRGAPLALPLEIEEVIVDGVRAGYSMSHLAKMHGVSRTAVSLAVRRQMARSAGSD
jgi:hypothetical protein